MEGDRDWKNRVSLLALEIFTPLEQDSDYCRSGHHRAVDIDDVEVEHED